MALQPGMVLRDRYEVRRVIKAGGMGSVYEGLDRNLGDACAIKEMLDVIVQSDDSALIRRKFKEEAQMLVRLQHAGIPRVRDFFTQDDVCYIVMDLVHGPNLEQELEDCQGLTGEPFAAPVLVRDILQILDILVYLHGLDPPVIHRDIKPANLIRELKSSRIKLVDFGLARASDTGPTQTIIGTLGYCPLEQMQGRAEPRSDLYALGVTMHQLASGCRPAVLSLEPLEKVAPQLDPGLAEIIRKATAQAPEDRYASAEEMRAALQAWSARAGAAPPPPPPPPEPEPEPEPKPLPPPVLTTPIPPEPAPSPERSGWSPVQAGMVGVACLVFLGLGLWMGRPVAVAPTPSPTLVAVAVATPEPTATPVPAATPEPTPKPAPAHPPKPHPTHVAVKSQSPRPPAHTPSPHAPRVPGRPRYPQGAGFRPSGHSGRNVTWETAGFQLPPGFLRGKESPNMLLAAHNPAQRYNLMARLAHNMGGPPGAVRGRMRAALGRERWHVQDLSPIVSTRDMSGWAMRMTRGNQTVFRLSLLEPDGRDVMSFDLGTPARTTRQQAFVELCGLAESLDLNGVRLPPKLQTWLQLQRQ